MLLHELTGVPELIRCDDDSDGDRGGKDSLFAATRVGWLADAALESRKLAHVLAAATLVHELPGVPELTRCDDDRDRGRDGKDSSFVARRAGWLADAALESRKLAHVLGKFLLG